MKNKIACFLVTLLFASCVHAGLPAPVSNLFSTASTWLFACAGVFTTISAGIIGFKFYVQNVPLSDMKNIFIGSGIVVGAPFLGALIASLVS